MIEINFENPLQKMRSEEWATLTADEKAFSLQYERVMKRDEKTTFAMVKKMTELYEKYPDINILACIPKRELPAKHNEGSISYE